MDVLIVMTDAPYIEGTTIWAPFVAIGRATGFDPLAINFRVAYQFGLTAAQQRTGIINAAKAARDAYATATGTVFPAVNSIEILGV